MTTPYIDLPSLAIEMSREQYRDMVEAWRDLDGKAQGLTTIAGIFLGGIFALFSRDNLQLGHFATLLLISSILLLLATFIGAIASLFVKPAKAAPSSELVFDVAKAARDATDQEKIERLNRLHNDLFDRWKEANDDLSRATYQKGCVVRLAQVSLMLATITVSTLAGIIALHAGAST